MNRIKLYLRFYNTFSPTSLLLSGICTYFCFKHGASIYSILFWFKLATLALTYFYIREYKSKEFFYYQNHGISKNKTLTISFTFDLLIYITLTITATILSAQ